MTGPGARAAALELLGAVLRQHLPLDRALEGHAGLAALSARDRAFARQMTATALRRLGQIDDILDRFLDRRPTGRAAVALDALRLGAAQILFLRTPAHAAVGETVSTVPKGVRGLVNAVLRRVARDGPSLAAAQDAGRLNTPEWLWRRWVAAYGEATTRAIAAAHLAEPPLDLSVKHDPEGWAGRLGGTVVLGATVRLARTARVEELEGFAEGAWWVQDAAAALPVRLIGNVAGKAVADLCAAPGGKTAQLAAAGARVTAVDRSAERLVSVRANLDRLGLEAQTKAADAAEWRPAAPLDAVLVDAPCLSTGTIRRHPDTPWLKREGDIGRLVEVQGRLLEAAVGMTRPGGIVLYCTCSLQPEEGERRVAALLEAGAPVERDRIGVDELPPELADAVTADGDVRTLPHHLAEAGGLDGFYIARLRRV